VVHDLDIIHAVVFATMIAFPDAAVLVKIAGSIFTAVVIVVLLVVTGTSKVAVRTTSGRA
jgi:hypothetical protein